MTTKVAVVTAGSTGIGAGIVRVLARDHHVFVMSRSDGAQRIAAEVGGTAVSGSVTDDADLQRLVDTAVARFGRIDAVAMNTGHPPRGDLLALSRKDWADGMDLMFHSLLRLMQLVTPVFLEQKSGAMVVVTTYATRTPELEMPVSSVVRCAVQAWVKLYATRYAADGIRANSVLPGFVATHPVDPVRLASIPTGRYADPQEIGNIVAFLLSDAASFITGQSIMADGGMTPIP